jgi:hypothetical protein
VATSSIRIAKEYERDVVFRLGRLTELKGPVDYVDVLRIRSRVRPEQGRRANLLEDQLTGEWIAHASHKRLGAASYRLVRWIWS